MRQSCWCMPRGEDDHAPRPAAEDLGRRDEAMAMPEERLVRLLSLVDVLEPLSEEELRDLARWCANISVRDGEEFYSPELHDGGLFLILEGRVRVYLTPLVGKEVTLNLLCSGTALWSRRLKPMDSGDAVHARAVGPAELAFVGCEDLERLVLRKPEVGLRMMALLAERLSESNERMAEVARKEVLPRLAGQVLRLLEGEGVVNREGYRLPTAYTHEELGAMVGAERVAVTRAMGRLQDEGVVELRRRRIHVKDPEVLRRIAEQGR
jgi:CRP/FNR family transcriptional regulator, cyclic AMP receptor protein